MSKLHIALVTCVTLQLGCARSPAPVVERVPAPAAPIDLGSEAASKTRLRVLRVGHASVLLDFDGRFVLTDPWFSEKPAYHHGEKLGLSLEQIPRLAAVVASHAHYDHFDIETFAAYPHKDVPFFVGPGMVEAAREQGFNDVRELVPWQSATANGVTITAAPASHGVPEVTFLLQRAGFTVYFGADTLLTPAVRSIATRFPEIDLALTAVNGLRVLGRQVVMNPEEAATLIGLLKAGAAVPTHYAFTGSWFTNTFILGYDGTPERFVSAVAKASPRTETRILVPGQWLSIDK